MEHGSSLPNSQALATRLYPQSNTTPFHFQQSHFNITLPPSFISSSWPFTISSPHQNPVCTSTVSHTCHIPRPSHSSSSVHPRNIWRAVQIIKLHVMQSSPSTCYLVALRFKYFSQHPILEHPQPIPPTLNMRDQVSHPYKTTEKLQFFFICVHANYVFFFLPGESLHFL